MPRDQVLLAKWCGGYTALVLPFLLSVLSGLVIVVLFPSVELRADHYAELGGIAILAMDGPGQGVCPGRGIFRDADEPCRRRRRHI